jgi:hypothetical protein
MLTILSSLIILVGIASLAFTLISGESAPPVLQKLLGFKKGFGIVFLGVICLTASESFYFANEGTNYYILSPTGTRSVVTSPGIKLITPGSTIQAWSKFYDVKAMKVRSDGSGYIGDTDGIEGIVPNGVSVRFIDKVTADVYFSLRFQMPDDEESFIRLVETYRHPQNLINNTLIPTVQEQLRNVTFMYTAEEYVSGGATDYRMTIDDALKNGGFVVEKKEVNDTIWSNSLTIDSLTTMHRQVKEIRTLMKNEKVLSNGIPKRIPHEINANKIITASVIVDNVILDIDFEDKLKQQRDISAQKIIEIQKIETARAAEQRIKAEGERDKAAEKAKREIQAVDILIAEETRIKQEESKRQLAEIALKTARLDAEKKRVDAQAEKIKLQLADGLSETEKYKIDKQAEVDKARAASIATAFQKLQTVIISGGKGGASEMSVLESLISSKLIDGKVTDNK